MATTVKRTSARQPTLADLQARRKAIGLDVGSGPELDEVEAQITERILAEDRTAAAAREQAAERIAGLRQRIILGYARRAALAAQGDQQPAALRETVVTLLRDARRSATPGHLPRLPQLAHPRPLAQLLAASTPSADAS
jgi:hypothetical protein